MLKSLYTALKEFLATFVVIELLSVVFQYTKELNTILAKHRGYTFLFLAAYLVFRGIIIDAKRHNQLSRMHEKFTQTLQNEPQGPNSEL